MKFIYVIFFLLWLLPFEFGDYRILGIPIAYFPFFTIYFYLLNNLFQFKFSLSNISIPAILLVFYLFLGSLFSNHPIYGFFYSVLFLLFFSPFFLLPKYITNDSFESLIINLTDILFYLAILGLLNIIRVTLYPPPGFTIYDIGSAPFIFMNKNAFIFLFIPAIPFFYINNLKERSLKSRFKFLIIILASFLLMSRSAIIAAIVVLFFLFFRYGKRSIFKIKNIFRNFSIFFLLTFFVLTNDFVLDKLSESLNIINILTGDFDADFRDMHRAEIVVETKNMIFNNPFFGVGVGTQNFVSNINPSSFQNEHQFTVPHNFYLSMTAQLGIPFALFLFIYLFFICFRLYRINIVYRYSFLFYLSMLSMLIMFIGMEYFFAPFIWIFLILAFHILRVSKV